jgi:hypothetical protein
MLGAFWSWSIVIVMTLARAQADEPPDNQAYRTFAAQAATYIIRGKKSDHDLEFRAQSLLNWGNPARQQERGSVFAWLADGRPQVIGSIFTYELGGAVREKVEFHSLSEDPLMTTHDGQLVWTPAANAISWRTLEDAPPPSATDQKRLVQMRTLARRFGVVLVSPMGDRDELRLMTQPLLRYAAPKAKVLDGAIFSFVVATDPEALLLIEAVGPPHEQKWRYAFARFHYWELVAKLDDRLVWSVEPDPSQAMHNVGDPEQMTKPYVSFHPRVKPSQ